MARAEAAGLDRSTVHAVRLCAAEAAANIVAHAYAVAHADTLAVAGDGGAPPWLRVTFRAPAPDGARAVVVFEDAGRPFDPTAHRPAPVAPTIEQAALGGAGIRLMRGFATGGMRYARVGRRNHLTLLF